VEIVRTLGVVPTAPSEARRSLHALGGALPADRLDDLRLVVSELVTNAVIHSGLPEEDAIVLKVRVFARRIRVEVIDRGRGFPEALSRRADHHGFGLPIVEELADRWGTEKGSETRVWAELGLGG
jgi:anti-sigma regulatory factor (Ser/Thr protein kinase)